MDAIAAVYDALDDEDAYARLPTALAAQAGARSAILQRFTRDWVFREATTCYFSREMIDRYVAEDLARLDPWRAVGARPQALNTVFAMDDLLPPEDFVHTAFFAENFRYWGDDTVRCLGAVFELEDGFLTLGVHRGYGSQAFSPADEGGLAPLGPHLRRMLELRGRLAEQRERAELAEAALDNGANAVIAVDARGRPMLMNRQAEALIAAGEVLTLARGALLAREHAAQRALAGAVAQACARRDAQGGALRLPRRTGPPLRAVVSPLSAGAVTHALVVVNDPAAADPRQVSDLRAFYGLSAGEAETAIAIARGGSPAEVAAARDVALATVRTQIRAALRKTQARGIPELVALIASVPARGKHHQS